MSGARQGRRAGLKTLIAAAALTLALPSVAQAAFPGRDGLIAFTRCLWEGCESPTEAYVTDATGSDIDLLRPDRRLGSWTLDWHPDGSMLLDSGGEGGPVIFRYLSSAPDREFLPGAICPQVTGARWSPDGRRIALQRHSQGCTDSDPRYDDGIWVMNADGSNGKHLFGSSGLTVFGDPAWSPDGRQLAFTARENADADWDIFVGHADGSLIRNVTRDRAFSFEPTWSPDGKSIAYVSDGDVWSSPPSGDSRKQLTRTAAREANPDYSPTGSRITYLSDWDVWVMNADGSSQRNLTRTPGTPERYPDWQTLPTTAALLAPTKPTLDAGRYVRGQTITARAELRNETSSAIVMQRGVITARPPGSTRRGGPRYYDFSGGTPTETVAARSARVLNGRFVLPPDAPLGRYDVYATYRDDKGVWHDGPGTFVDVTAPGAPVSGQQAPGESTTPGQSGQAPGAQPPAGTPLAVRLGKVRGGLRTLRARGVRVGIRCSAACRLRGRILFRGRTVATAKASRSRAGTATLRLKATRRGRARLGLRSTATVTLRIDATDAGGKTRRVSRRLRMR